MTRRVDSKDYEAYWNKPFSTYYNGRKWRLRDVDERMLRWAWIMIKLDVRWHGICEILLLEPRNVGDGCLVNFKPVAEYVVVLCSGRLRSSRRRRQRCAVNNEVDDVQQQRHVPLCTRLLVSSRCLRHDLDVPRWRTLDLTQRPRL